MKDALSILIVEDNPGDALLTRTLIEGTSLNVREIVDATTIAELSKKAALLRFDVVLLDLSLPDAFGPTTVTTVQEFLPEVPVIVLTGIRNTESARVALQLGAQDYLVKDEITEALIEKSIRYSLERTENLRNMRMSEERYRQLFDLNPQPMYAYDENTLDFLMVNRAAVQHYGYSKEEFLSMKLSDIRPKTELPRMLRALDEQRGSARARVTGAWLHQKKDGTVIEVEIQSIRYTMKDRNARLVLIDDVTQKKRTLNHLLRLESVINNISDAILITEAQPMEGSGPRIVYANPAFERNTGYRLEELIGQTPRLLQGPATDRATLGQLKKSIAELKPMEAEVVNYRKDGSTFWNQFYVMPLADQDGNYTHWISVQRDVTDRKVAEEAQRVLTNELLEHNRDLQQFSFITSHNLRGPIANMKALLSMFAESEFADNDRELVDQMEVSVAQLEDVLNDLIQVLLLRSQTDLDAEELDLHEVFAVVSRHLDREILSSGATITVDFSQVSRISYNRVYLESIFLNLLTNAIKYRSNHRPLLVHIQSELKPGYVTLKFKDNGLGIDLGRYSDRLFGLYQRFHTHKEGKGMGLYITNQQVLSLGGRIEVESRVGEGSVFCIYIKTN